MSRYESQRRIPGSKRNPVASAVYLDLETAINRECIRWRVSRSFVIAVALSEALGVKLDDYRKRKRPSKRPR